jgi:hypothetical protein
MIDIGVASPSAHGHAMISTATALISACASRGSGRRPAHTANVTTATPITAGTNQPATASASFWIGARLRCASAPCARSARGSVSAPTRSARITSVPVPFTVAPVTRSPRSCDRDRLARDHRLVDRRLAFEHDAVDRDLLAGPHAQPVARRAISSSGDVALRPVSAIRRAVFGARSSSARIAAPVRLRARSSST